MNFRQLTQLEIQRLEAQGCRCSNWQQVVVAQGFDPKYVINVTLSGHVTLGFFEKEVTLPSGAPAHSGIFNAYLHQCKIGNNVYISNVGSSIANYHIDDEVIVENVGSIYTEGLSTFGNGLEINTVNESGERAIPMYNELTSQVAYTIAFGHNDMQVVAALEQLIKQYAEKQSSNVGYISKNVRITSCNLIKNVKIGEAAIIEGAQSLTNGSINSTADAPSYIGSGVTAHNFIMCNNSRLSDSALIQHCFIGQGVHLGRLFSAEHSLFFANSECFNGEACSIFAGPYTVSHHKSTLLIAGTFSFYNAGSGTNQSNHMYKLGPIHQGVLDRGCKTGSGAYLMFPAHVGAFSVILGTHKNHIDTTVFPFSYIVEKEEITHVIPGMNLRSVGIRRDIQKWPARDARKATRKLDLINFESLTPYSMGAILQGIEALEHLQSQAPDASVYSHNGVKISRGALIKGVQYYNEAINTFLYKTLVIRLAKAEWSNAAELQTVLQPINDTAIGIWHDIAGMYTPASEMSALFESVKNGSLQSIEQVVEIFENIHSQYDELAWVWAADLLQKRTKKPIAQLTAKEIIDIVAKGAKAEDDVTRTLKSEAAKDIELLDKMSFDLDRYRHSTDNIPFVANLVKQAEEQQIRNAELLKRLEAVAINYN